MYICRLCLISHDIPFMGQRGSPEVSWPVLPLHPLPRGLAGHCNVQCHSWPEAVAKSDITNHRYVNVYIHIVPKKLLLILCYLIYTHVMLSPCTVCPT